MYRITATDKFITSILFGEVLPNNDNTITDLARTQLEAYFSGELTNFQLPLATNGTAFQQRVWDRSTRYHMAVHLFIVQLLKVQETDELFGLQPVQLGETHLLSSSLPSSCWQEWDCNRLPLGAMA